MDMEMILSDKTIVSGFVMQTNVQGLEFHLGCIFTLMQNQKRRVGVKQHMCYV